MTQARHRDAGVTLAGLALLIAWEMAGLDRVVSHWYGGVAGFRWRHAWLTSTLLHEGGRVLAGVLLGVLAIDCARPLLAGPPRPKRMQALLAAVAAMLLVPGLKRASQSSCPWDLAEFGGSAPYVPHWLANVVDGGPGHCFPSGHATSAFAFFSVYFVWRQYRPRAARWWLGGVLAIGAVSGWVQVARGAHFASHALWSAWLCWLLCLVATRFVPAVLCGIDVRAWRTGGRSTLKTPSADTVLPPS